jgi:hypothetical protein
MRDVCVTYALPGKLALSSGDVLLELVALTSEAYVSIRQHTSRIRQHFSAYALLELVALTSEAYVSIRQHTSRIRQHTSAYALLELVALTSKVITKCLKSLN